MTAPRAGNRNTRRSQTQPARRAVRPRPRRIGWKRWLFACSGAAILGLFAWAAIARRTASASNTSLTRFDAIVVLGTSVDADGNPTPILLARVTEAVHEYERGVAPRLIVTGGSDSNHFFVEAQVMARTAQAQGIPASAIVEEPRAVDTIQNACYSMRILQSHGWSSAEVVSSANHLPRAALIFGRLPLQWRMHAAPPLAPESSSRSAAEQMLETLKTVRYLVWARATERCEP